MISHTVTLSFHINIVIDICRMIRNIGIARIRKWVHVHIRIDAIIRSRVCISVCVALFILKIVGAAFAVVHLSSLVLTVAALIVFVSLLFLFLVPLSTVSILISLSHSMIYIYTIYYDQKQSHRNRIRGMVRIRLIA